MIREIVIDNNAKLIIKAKASATAEIRVNTKLAVIAIEKI
jgi:L-lactate utilization protein LutB